MPLIMRSILFFFVFRPGLGTQEVRRSNIPWRFPVQRKLSISMLSFNPVQLQHSQQRCMSSGKGSIFKSKEKEDSYSNIAEIAERMSKLSDSMAQRYHKAGKFFR